MEPVIHPLAADGGGRTSKDTVCTSFNHFTVAWTGLTQQVCGSSHGSVRTEQREGANASGVFPKVMAGSWRAGR